MEPADKNIKVERFTFGPYDLDVLCRRHLDQTLNFKLTVQCSKESIFESLRDFGGGMPSSDSDEERDGDMVGQGNGESLVGDVDLLGLDIWPAAITLCEYLERHWSQLIKGQLVIELGAGIGLPCLLCARMGASKAVITDYDPKVVSHVCENSKKCSVSGVCQGLCLNWTECAKDAAGHEHLYGVVLAADILYDGGIVKNLVETMEYVMQPCGLLLISHQQRRSLVLDDMKIPTVVEEDVSFQTFRRLMLNRGFSMRILGERESPGFPGSMLMLGFSQDKEKLECIPAYPEMNTLL